MVDKVIEVIAGHHHLIVGGIVIYAVTFVPVQFLRRLLVDEWHDFAFFLIAVIFATIYAIISQSAMAGLEAFAGSQVLHAVVKKGLLGLILGLRS